MEQQELLHCIRSAIRDNIDKEYTKYKNKCLSELDKKLEIKRNETVCSILNSIDISTDCFFQEPEIVIKMTKNK